ncbi:MAG TPA: PAS domain S-box protein [Pyrinomonadaceae bacterium]|nr:PAS domain S-box protein [Pyrinomonadaceae bacterium]
MSNGGQNQAENTLTVDRNLPELPLEPLSPNSDSPSALRRYGVSLGLFALTLGIAILLTSLEFKINLTILVVATLVAATWYGGRGPGLLLALLVSGATILLNPIPPDTSVARIIFSHFSVLSLLIFVVFLISGRKKVEKRLRESEKRYRHLFENSPLPMWVYEIGTLKFIAVNDAAISSYGYSRKEFLAMNIKDIRPAEDLPALLEDLTKPIGKLDETDIWKHRKKDGTIIDVEVTSHELIFDEKFSRLVLAHDVTERKQIEQSLRQAEASYRNLVELSPAIVYLAKPFPPYETIYVSPNVIKFGYQPQEWFSKNDMWISLVHEEDRARVLQMTEEAMSHNLDTDLEYRIVSRDSSIHWVHDKGCLVFDKNGNKIGWQGLIVDISETKQLGEQLRQSQKLESVGKLAGGIAHDFNNMLTAINGYSELTLRRLKKDDPLRRNIEEIKKAAERSAELTHQLLAFSRRQILKPKIVNINEVIDETSNMLQRLIGEDVQYVSILSPSAGQVEVDPGQLSQILMNLAVNARDAMPQGGKLTVETANVFLDPVYVQRHAGVLPGAYVQLAVSDNGSGMNAETKSHIFEPFFTTKPIGQGTGLGLATVYGIVKQSGGNINIYSEEGIGTTFKIYLPRVPGNQAEEIADLKNYDKELLTGKGSILLVEDEEIVRTLTRQVLEEYGYTIHEARNGIEALEIAESINYNFDLLMTDVVMPQMGGRDLSNKLKEKLPHLQVLFTSGYTDDAVVRNGVIEIGTNFIQKPFSPDSLANKIREILNNPN